MTTALDGPAVRGRSRRISPVAAWLWGGAAVGVLDAIDAFLFFGLRGIPPSRILQSIAAGLLGRAAFQGGTGTVVLGLALHFMIALAIVGTFFVGARAVPLLARRPYVAGPLFGLAAYGVMNFVVVPLSAAASGPAPAGAVLINGVLIHALGVGLPAALFARAAFAERG
jgi:hypothetical protein